MNKSPMGTLSTVGVKSISDAKYVYTGFMNICDCINGWLALNGGNVKIYNICSMYRLN